MMLQRPDPGMRIRLARSASSLDGIGVANQLETLCASLPSLCSKPGTSPWNGGSFLKWASDPGKTDIERYVAGLVLQVATPATSARAVSSGSDWLPDEVPDNWMELIDRTKV